eukprot:GHVU01225380.1.p1 GENE.GHVU01225380.1~~GHVU01225380.1.p1  ORF type:complete len:250 (+),score=69.03 GHVU01225380.1:368-1117(+)
MCLCEEVCICPGVVILSPDGDLIHAEIYPQGPGWRNDLDYNLYGDVAVDADEREDEGPNYKERVSICKEENRRATVSTMPDGKSLLDEDSDFESEWTTDDEEEEEEEDDNEEEREEEEEEEEEGVEEEVEEEEVEEDMELEEDDEDEGCNDDVADDEGAVVRPTKRRKTWKHDEQGSDVAGCHSSGDGPNMVYPYWGTCSACTDAVVRWWNLDRRCGEDERMAKLMELFSTYSTTTATGWAGNTAFRGM